MPAAGPSRRVSATLGEPQLLPQGQSQRVTSQRVTSQPVTSQPVTSQPATHQRVTSHPARAAYLARTRRVRASCAPSPARDELRFQAPPPAALRRLCPCVQLRHSASEELRFPAPPPAC